MAVIVAITLVRQFIEPGSKATNFPIYLGVYFLANGILSFKEARSGPSGARREALAAVTSIIGGLALIVTYPFSSYRESLIATDIGRYAFSAIVIIIGLLQTQGAVHMTPQPIVKHAHLVFGFLEILLGLVVLAAPIDWEANLVALVWITLIAIYMLFVAHRLRGALSIV
jgi:uncharacterized membrane protein HdeD (DUF308 family)